MANASQSFSDKLAKYIAIIGGTLAICAALGVPTQLGAFGEFRIPGLPSRVVTSLSLSQDEGPSRTKVTVSGGGFDAGEIVDIRFDREKIGEATVDGDGAFSVDVRIPSSFDAIGGAQTYDISATGRSSVKHASQPFRLLVGGGGQNTGSAANVEFDLTT
jgi:hypothetical protein